MNRNDRKIAVAALMLLLAVLVFLLLTDQGAPTADVQTDSLSVTAPFPRRSRSVAHGEPLPVRRVETFPFDPNTADSAQLRRLGLQDWQIRNIYKYRAHGGVYRRKEDFARLYGLTVKDYRRLEPYIRISDDYRPAATLLTDSVRHERDTLRYPVKLAEGETIVLNGADTTQLKKVPGIGSYYAREIVRYGERLGGYVSVDQLDEIDDFPHAAKKYFSIRQPVTRKLRINSLSLQELRRHPYINYYQAKAIVDYRRLKGPIESLQQLRLSADFPPEAISRLEPYVEY